MHHPLRHDQQSAGEAERTELSLSGVGHFEVIVFLLDLRRSSSA